MSSLRLLVLDWVQQYIGRWDASPSYGEIAQGLGISRKRVFKAVRSLVNDGLLLRRPGPRGLAMPTQIDAALRVLQAFGWVTAAPGETLSGLLPPPALDYGPAPASKEQAGGDEDSEQGGA